MTNRMEISIAFIIALQISVALSTTEPFTCVGKVIGGYYADVNSGCQMFHVCTLGNEGVLNDIVFRCLQGTVFEQKTRVCERTEEVDCSESEKFFYLNNELYGPGIIPDTAMDPLEAKSSTSKQVLDPSDALKGLAPPERPQDTPHSTKPSTTTQPTTTNRPSTTITTQSSTFIQKQPFTVVTRTASSTSVSTSARVHIQTPLSRFSFHQGADSSRAMLPAPHLRPSLLKLAAAQGKTQLSSSNRRARGALPPFLLFRRPHRHRPRRSTKIYSPTPPHRNIFKDFLLRLNPSFRDDSDSFLTQGHIDMTQQNQHIFHFVSHMASFVEGRAERKEIAEGTKWAKTLTNRAPSTFSCHNQPRPGFYADIDHGCEVFHFCQTVDKLSDKQRITYTCSQENEAFDIQLGKCAPKDLVKCAASESTTTKGSPQEITKECRILGTEIRIADTTQACRSYFGCAIGSDGNTALHSWECTNGKIFSQINQKCLSPDEVQCLQETYPIMRKFSYIEEIVSRVEMGLTNPPIDQLDINRIRKKRSSLFDTQSAHREPSNGPNSGIFSDHSSVIDNQSPGNGLQGRVAVFIPEEKKTPTEVPSPSSHALNKTLVNGTIIEVSEIESPDQSGKVTITSVVPKLVRQNGKGKETENEKPEIPLSINVATGQSKVTLSGGSANTVPLEDSRTSDKQSDQTTTVPMDEVTTSAPEEASTEEATTTPTPTTTTTTTPAPTTTTTTTTTATPTKPNLSTSAPDEIVETNFTCRDKDLERFYPDIEADCKVFHYCAPGFSEDQVLDLKFLCTGETRFDSKTSKCQDMTTVTCEAPAVPQGLKVSSTAAPTTARSTTASTTKATTTTSAPTPSTTSSTTTSAVTTTPDESTTTVTSSTPGATSTTMSDPTTTDDSTSMSTASSTTTQIVDMSKTTSILSSTTDETSEVPNAASTQESQTSTPGSSDATTASAVTDDATSEKSTVPSSTASQTTIMVEDTASTSKDDNSSSESSANPNEDDVVGSVVSTIATKETELVEADSVSPGTSTASSSAEGSTSTIINEPETSTINASTTTEAASSSASDATAVSEAVPTSPESDGTLEPEETDIPSS